jgi:hypothetical protein
MRAVLWLMVVSMSGCLGGGGYCKTVARDLEKQCDYESDDADIEACEQSLESCTAKEERQLEKFYKCTTKDSFDLYCPAEPSSPGTTYSTTDFDDDFADLADLLACVSEIADVSQACLDGSFGSTSSTGYSYSTTTY